MIHAHIIKTGAYEDLFLMTFVVNVYGKCGAMKIARKVFDGLSNRNIVTWTSLMSGYVQNSEPEIGIGVFNEMLEDGNYQTNYTLGIVLNICSMLHDVKLGKQIQGFIVKYKIENDASIENALCRLYSKCDNLNFAVKAFLRTGDKNMISWTKTIYACGDNIDSAMGLSLFADILYEGVEPNEFTFTSVLSLFCIMQVMGVGSQVHSLSIKLGYETNLRVTNSIMYLYMKCGWINDAKKLFDGMETINLVTWNAMIASHAQMMELGEDNVSAHHNGIEALNIFLRLNKSSTRPDLIYVNKLHFNS